MVRSLLWILLLAPLARGQEPETAVVIPGLQARHPLEPVAVGRLLLDELSCGACHAGLAPSVVPSAAPDLSAVGGRLTPGELERFLLDPAAARPGTKMPALLHALPPGERPGAARALTHFLVSVSSTTWSRGEVRAQEIEAGDELYHTVGCVACHAPRRPPSHAYGVDSLAEFLFQPAHARPSGRMPDMGLTRQEARELASYLIGADPPASAPLQVQAELVAEGRRTFEQLACAACHPLEGLVVPPPVEGVGELDPQRGCLAEGDTEAPRFQLDRSQRAAITSALQAPEAELSDRERIDLTLTAFNCIACHVRDDYGGVLPDIDAYFETDEHDLGDEARIPPQLTLVGAKLQGAWLRRVLFEGASVRPYMFTRMPRFGEAHLARLPELLEREDAGRIQPFAMPLPESEEQARIARDAGRELMGIRGLGCVACHDFNGTPSPTHGGVDLINSPEMLQPTWFARFLYEPQTYRPGIVMPESWSGGVASHPGILDGDCDAQIRALWTYLSQGRTARDPDGIHPEPARLFVTDTARTYRGRSSVAGFRGIAVGFPGGLSYAFNAQTGALSALWRGDFVSVRWDGQGAGGFSPSGKVIALAQDVSFCRLADADAPWPLRPRMDEEHPVNPDPLYPRNHGYRFEGYSLDADSIPTFRYASGGVSIEDRSVADTRGERPILRRTLRFTPPTAEALSFRVLTGDFETLSAREVRTPGLLLRLPDVPAVVRSAAEEGRPRELLLQLPAGSSTVTIDYELLD